jgi:hypothetical protein
VASLPGFHAGRRFAGGHAARLGRGRAGLIHTPLDVGQRLLHLVDQDQAQIAGLQLLQRAVDGGELAVDLFHLAGARGAFQALAQQGQHLAIGAAALAGVLVEDDRRRRRRPGCGSARGCPRRAGRRRR